MGAVHAHGPTTGLGAHFLKLVNGVIAGVPSSVVYPGWPDDSQPAWTLGGRPLPAVSPSDFGQPNPPGKPRAVIPVERIGGPILLTCGGQDVSGRLAPTATPSPRVVVGSSTTITPPVPQRPIIPFPHDQGEPSC
jgi:hypothetical protein